MKIYLYLLCSALLFCSCGNKKSNDPAPEPPPPPAVVTPVITSFTPLSAEKGMEITVTGEQFGTDKANIKILIGSVVAETEIIALTDTKLVFKLLAASKSGTITIERIKESKSATSSASFEFIPDYIVKTVGISRVMIALDRADKLVLANLWGGGNRVILKPGTGNTMQPIGDYYSMVPDGVTHGPDGRLDFIDQVIDNGTQPDTSGTAAVFKIKGFDKKKKGYNQLNLVMHEVVWNVPEGWAGYRTNVTYIDFTDKGASNNYYGMNFLKQLFSGNVKVDFVEIAKPLSQHPYIVEDHIAQYGSAGYNIAEKRITRTKLNDTWHEIVFRSNGDVVAPNLKVEWVNASSGKITGVSDYSFEMIFDNIKKGNMAQIAEPKDSVNKVFLRVSGFDQKKFGYDALRIFLTDNGFGNGGLIVTNSDKMNYTPSVEFAKEVFLGKGTQCVYSSPEWPHH